MDAPQVDDSTAQVMAAWAGAIVAVVAAGISWLSQRRADAAAIRAAEVGAKAAAGFDADQERWRAARAYLAELYEMALEWRRVWWDRGSFSITVFQCYESENPEIRADLQAAEQRMRRGIEQWGDHFAKAWLHLTKDESEEVSAAWHNLIDWMPWNDRGFLPLEHYRQSSAALEEVIKGIMIRRKMQAIP